MNQKTYWPYIIIAFAGLFALGLLDNIRGPFYSDILRDLSLTENQGSFFYSVVPAIMIFASTLTPTLLNWFRPIAILRIGLFLMGFGFFFYLFATELWQLIAIGVFFGFGFSIVTVIQNYVIQVGAEPRLRQRLFSGLHAFYALASLLVPLFAIGLRPLGWKAAFALCASIPILVGLLSFFIKTQKNVVEIRSRGNKMPAVVLYHGLLLSLALAFYLAAEISVGTRLVHFLRIDLGYDPSYASLHLFAFFLAMFIGRVSFARFHPQLSPRGCILICAVGGGIFYILGLFVNPWLFFMVGLFLAPFFPLFLEYLSERFGNYWDKIMGLTLGLASAGNMGMHNLVGYLTDIYGIQLALLIGPISLFFLFVIFLVHKYIKLNSV